jgi:acylphosphatase
MAKICLVVDGKVQGVFYRQSALEFANSLGLTGWIKNNPDGSVEAEVVGPQDKVVAFLEWTKKGPPRARVDKVTVLNEDMSDENGLMDTYECVFRIVH